MKAWLLTIVFLSSGVYEEQHVTQDTCIAAIIEASLTKENDIWSAACFGPDDQLIATDAKGDIGP